MSTGHPANQNQDIQQDGARSVNESEPRLYSHPNEELALRLFARGEAFDAEGFATFFHDEPVYQFGNFDACLDRVAIITSAQNFFSQISAVYHDIKTLRAIDSLVLVEMDVQYWRLDGSLVVLPCADIFRVEDGQFRELRIFMDVNPVLDPGRGYSPSSSVFAANKGENGHPSLMRRFFSEHPEGRRRRKEGYPPRWSLAGPGWTIPEHPAPGDRGTGS